MPRTHARTACRVQSLIGLLAAALLASAAAAQEGYEPDPIEQPTEPAEQEPQPIPGLEEADFRIRPAGITPEGTFLSRRAGRIATLPTGERAFVFHPDEQGLTLRPMVLIPSLTLQRMEQSMEDRDPGFLITGEVFVYLGVNYLLPSAFSITPTADPRAPAAAPRTPASPDEGQPPAADPAVDDLIHQLEQQRQRPRASDPNRPLTPPPSMPQDAEDGRAAADPLDASPSGAAGLVPEGQTLSRRRGRVIRLAAGEWAVAFDSGPRQQTTLDRPLILLPSLNLQRLQGWAGTYGDTIPLEISGRITQYRGRNYLIPTLYRIAPVTTPLEPIQ